MTIEAEIRKRLKAQVSLKFGGNDNRSMREVAVDMIHASGMDWKSIAHGTYLAKSTIKNLATEKTQYPRYDTIERVYKFFEYEANLKPVTLKAEYANQPKNSGKRRNGGG